MITLHNGLRALLISDEKTDKAAVSMAVGIGHLSDPVSLQWGARVMDNTDASAPHRMTRQGKSTLGGSPSALGSPELRLVLRVLGMCSTLSVQRTDLHAPQTRPLLRAHALPRH